MGIGVGVGMTVFCVPRIGRGDPAKLCQTRKMQG